ncbi:hypothetical protein QBC46DRAFT_413729 [Diplogelasinospora grovesii]|uniref:Uncharacterized protein n=1 Tax=Diplogelasinospora grovesii TaxID=303347 RepID=A0AAN6MX98_9PEZI|nr:hypothetical protein QBC46DRAFT_413729 [Diplogelasinospora grovesii]
MSGPSTPQRTAAAELLLVSPMALSGLALSSSRKRRITPTAEATSPKRIAIITSPGAPLHKPTLPRHAGTDLQVPPPARHLILPFDPRDEPDAFYDREKRAMMLHIFPGTTGIATDGWSIHLQLRTLPPKPWPLTIAGLPLYLQLEMGPGPMPPTRLVSRKNGSIAGDQNGRDMEDWEPLFHVIKGHFQGLGVSITEVMYCSNAVFIVLKHRDTDFNKLPWRAANIVCFYLFDDEMGRPSAPQARRLLDPAPGNPDDSQYDTLQPGLRVTSPYLPGNPGMFLSTTTGVLLKDGVGNEFMTVASHGFPAECGTQVFHALPRNGREIGELIMEVSHTGIALVKLRDTETFSSVTFQSDSIPQPVQLKKLVRVKKHQRYDPVCLDSPDTGFIDGAFMMTSFQAIPSDDNSPEQNWIFTTWNYGGQDSAINLPEGMGGSAIWNEDGDVLGFFRYAPKEGLMKDWCTGIAADELINRGFALVNTSDRT